MSGNQQITFNFVGPSPNVSRSRTQSRLSQISPSNNRRLSSPAGSYPISRTSSAGDISQDQHSQQPDGSYELRGTRDGGSHAPAFQFNIPGIGQPGGPRAHEDEQQRILANGNLGYAQTEYTENRDLKRKLGALDVAALIMNKMIGAGIFTTPGTVLFLTQSKRLSIVLWVLGGVYSLISFSIYLEYGLNFRYNGGDLIYLDEVWPRPELLSVVLYSGFFICFGNTAGNSVAFAKHVLAASSPQIHQTIEFDARLVSLIAVAVLTIICLLHYFSAETGLFLNRILAYYKTGLLFAVFVAGVMARNHPNSGRNDWSKSDSPHSSFSTLSAMIYILYSYQGWENANYVGGEIKVDKPDLQLGGYLAIIVTMILYVLATVGYYMACSFDTIVSKNSDLGMGQYFATQAFGGHTVGFKICIALSAVGNLIAVVFTSSKVKQCIARQRIIPFYTFFGDDDKQFGTPRGALVLHWFFTFILILAMPNTTDGYSFIIGMFTYGHLIVGLFVGWGIWVLRRRMRAFKQLEDWDFKFLAWNWLRNPLVFLWTGVNILVLVVAAKPHAAGTIPRKWWPIILLGMVVPVSFVYWAVLWSMQNERFGSKIFGVSAKVHHPDATIGRNAGRQQSDFEKMMMAARKDGSNRRTEYDFHGRTWARLEKVRNYLTEKFYKFLW